MQPSPVITLNRAVAVLQLRGPQAETDLIEPRIATLNAEEARDGNRRGPLPDHVDAAKQPPRGNSGRLPDSRVLRRRPLIRCR